jgi:hypothetical protein
MEGVGTSSWDGDLDQLVLGQDEAIGKYRLILHSPSSPCSRTLAPKEGDLGAGISTIINS